MSVNKVILIGNVGREPNVKYFDRDQAVASLTLATTERGYQLQNGTQVPDRTEWHNLVFWGGLAKTVEKYVHKGDKLYVEGSIRSRSYDDKNGITRTVGRNGSNSIYVCLRLFGLILFLSFLSIHTHAEAEGKEQEERLFHKCKKIFFCKKHIDIMKILARVRV